MLTNLVDPTWPIQSSIRANGKESGFYTELTFLKSIQNLDVFSGFGNRIHGEAQLEEEGDAMLFWSIKEASAVKCFSLSGAMRSNCCLIGCSLHLQHQAHAYVHPAR